MKTLLTITVLFFYNTMLTAQRLSYTIENNQLKTTMPVGFKTGTSVLDPASDSALQEVKSFLMDKKAITLLRIESHSAAANNENVVLKLTKERALAVAKWLVKNGVNSTRIIVVAFGSTKPIANNNSPEGRTVNNRIVFVNATMLNRPIGGMPVDGGGLVVCNPYIF